MHARFTHTASQLLHCTCFAPIRVHCPGEEEKEAEEEEEKEREALFIKHAASLMFLS